MKLTTHFLTAWRLMLGSLGWLSTWCAANPENANFTFTTANRTDAQAGFFRHYVPSEGWENRMGWTGALATCNPGTVSAAYFDDCLRRVNYCRVQAGLLGDITHNTTKSAKCQWASLIFTEVNNISHSPATDFPSSACLSADKTAHGGSGWGNEAAQLSSISLGATGPAAIMSYLTDSGTANTAVGHRRGFLAPRQAEMGFGGVPLLGTGHSSSSAVWNGSDLKSYSAALQKVVQWPNAGYIPYDVCPNPTNANNGSAAETQVRWSCGYVNANFTSATITMTRLTGAGAPVAVPIVKEAVQLGYNDSTVVWRVSNLADIVPPTPTQDIAYSIVIAGITLTSGSPPSQFTGAGPYSCAYTVTTFDPNYLSFAPTVSGSAAPASGIVNTYSVNQTAESSGLQVRCGTLSSAAWTEGAEAAPVPKIIDSTTGGYGAILIASTSTPPAATGAKIFHLAFASSPPVNQALTIDRQLIPSATSVLQFKQRFRWLSLDTTFNAEISTDDGSTWKSIWSRAGNSSSASNTSSTWETAYTAVSVPIPATYVGKVVRIRFTLTFVTGTYKTGSTGSYGVFFDDVTMTAAQEMAVLSTSGLASTATTYNFTPPSGASYVLHCRQEIGATHWFDWGPLTSVTAVAPVPIQTWRATNLGTATLTSTTSNTADPDGDGLPNLVEYAFGLNPLSANLSSPNLPVITKSGSNLLFTFKPTAAATGLIYTVQQAPSLTNSSWTTVSAINAAGTYTATVPNTGGHIFLRLKVDNPSGL